VACRRWPRAVGTAAVWLAHVGHLGEVKHGGHERAGRPRLFPGLALGAVDVASIQIWLRDMP
jgi:hypothetical protein